METLRQSVLFRLETDLHEIMEAILDNKLKDIEINYSDDEVVCVMLISGGEQTVMKKENYNWSWKLGWWYSSIP